MVMFCGTNGPVATLMHHPCYSDANKFFFIPRISVVRLAFLALSAGTQQASLQDGEEEERLQEGVQEEGQEGVRVRMLYLCSAFSPRTLPFFLSPFQSTFNINVAIILTHFHEPPVHHILRVPPCTSVRPLSPISFTKKNGAGRNLREE